MKDYYVVLGVASDATPRTIRQAFRRAALRHHPDRGDDGDPQTFLEASEAYDVLSDPRRRARYDHERAGRLAPARQAPRSGVPPVVPRDLGSLRVGSHPERVRPSWHDLLDRFGRNFSGAVTPKWEHPEPLNYELVMSPGEAREGVRLRFEIPIFSRCPQCAGTGRDWVFHCTNCAGQGRLVEPGAVRLVVPPGVRDGTVLERSLSDLGVENLWLRVHVRISPGGV